MRILPSGLARRFNRLRAEAEAPRARFALERTLALAREMELREAFLDVGCGAGEHVAFARAAGLFERHDGTDRIAREAKHEDRYFPGEFETLALPGPYDVVWCSHTLEHSLNPGLFIAALKRATKEDGLLCITVPPIRSRINVGHASVWNAGLLLINLVRNSLDCSRALIKTQGYNVSIILKKRECPPCSSFVHEHPNSCRPILPEGLRWTRNDRGVWYFDGEIAELNWR